MEQMRFLNDVNNDKYHMEKETLPDGRIKIMMTPKKTNCKGCSKAIEFAGANLFVWIDKDDYKREGRFCRTCKEELQQYGYFK